MKKFIPAIACFVLLASCRHEKIEHPTIAEAGKIVDAAEASFTSGDSFRIMEHYAPDAVMFDSANNEPTTDHAIATKWADAFVAMKPTAFSPGKRTLQILTDDVIVSSGVATMMVAGGNGPEKVAIRYTDIYQRQRDQSWLIVHEHLSNLPKPAGGTAAS